MPPPNTSSYLDYLPAIYTENPFLGQFLLAFEQILTGLEGSERDPKYGLENTIANVSQLFDPNTIKPFIDLLFPDDQNTDEKQLKEFLRWLAGWTALSLRADWSTDQQRQFIAKIVPLYRKRGTKENLEELLAIHTGLRPTIEEVRDTPHFFRINVYMGASTPADLDRKRIIIRSLVDLQKPAHTYYELTVLGETMQIGRRSTIGVDTLLGRIPGS